MAGFGHEADPTVECRICGAKATGLHYGVITCEGCKVFYKRYMGKHEHYRCYFGGSCQIDLRTRSRCKACRFKKCVEEGMSVDAIRLGRTPKMFKTNNSDVQAFRGSFGEVSRRTIQQAVSNSSQLFHQGQLDDQGGNQDPQHNYRDRPCPESLSPTSQTSSVISWRSDRKSVAQHNVTSSRSSLFDPTDCSTVPANFQSPPRITSRERSILTFSDENLNFMLNDFIAKFLSPPIRPGCIPDIAMPGSRGAANVPALCEPSTLQKYWGVMTARNNVLEESIRAVTDATEAVFTEQIKTNEESLQRFLVQGLIPFQPETSLDEMLVCVQLSVATFAERLFKFSVLLPGFTDLTLNDRTSLVRDRWYVTWLITHATSYVNGECYHTIGPFGFHYCRYWMKQMLDANFVRFVFSVTEEINELRLNKAETFMLLAVAIFKTDPEDTVEDRSYIDFLYSHYLDGLIHLIGPGRGELLSKLRPVIARFTVVNEVHRRFILQSNLDQAPLGVGSWDTEDMAAVTNRTVSEDAVFSR